MCWFYGSAMMRKSASNFAETCNVQVHEEVKHTR